MSYLAVLFITTIIELSVVYMLRYADEKVVLAVILGNIVTNPSINYLNQIFRFEFWHIVILELIAVLVEGLLINAMAKSKKVPAFGLAFVMNAVSFLIGLWLPWDTIGKLIH